MDPLIIPLAFGCILTFNHIDKAMTETDGREPDGIIYKTATLTDAEGRRHTLEPVVVGQGISPGSLFDAGPSPDGLFASYVVFMHGATRILNEVRFVSARTCAPVRFVRVRDGSTIDAASHYGWDEDSPHAVHVWDNAKPDSLGLPIDEAKLLNPAIRD